MHQKLEDIKQQAESALSQSNTLDDLEKIRIDYLGRKGKITAVMRDLKLLSPEDRPVAGARANAIQAELSGLIEKKQFALNKEALNEKLQAETIDVSMPGSPLPLGSEHPLVLVTQDICTIFEKMGFSVIEDDFCPEVETNYYNFDALNFPEHHPARDMQDTYYTTVGDHVLLRSQTSNAQVRYMEKHPLPVQVVSPGRVYRNEEVNSRKFVLFHQLEGLLVDRGIRFSDLKGILHAFLEQFFGTTCKTRFRNSFFPFTEPSAEVDVQCIFCKGSGCSVCGHLGWLEILGAGMVDPNVLQAVKIDSDVYTGLAFGMGIERLAMLKYAINDIRLFFNNDLRFLNQFKRL
ncbi:MAG: phenylalanine--tRNA ligase subunit alpha [Cyanobacteria bacterium P01_H01_bin.74]